MASDSGVIRLSLFPGTLCKPPTPGRMEHASHGTVIAEAEPHLVYEEVFENSEAATSQTIASEPFVEILLNHKLECILAGLHVSFPQYDQQRRFRDVTQGGTGTKWEQHKLKRRTAEPHSGERPRSVCFWS